jgi:hypothetical protein
MFSRLVLFCLLVALSIIYGLGPFAMEESIMAVLLAIVVASLVLFMLQKEKNPNIKGQFLKHSTLVILSIIIVHFQYYADYLLGNANLNNWRNWVNRNVVMSALMLSVIGLVAFFIGYLSNTKTKTDTTVPPNEKPLKVTILLYLAAGSLAGYLATVNPLYLSGLYGSEEMGGTATYAVLLFSTIVFAIIIQNCRNMIVSGNIPTSFKEYVKQQGYILTIMIAIYLVTVMLSGDRGAIITYTIAYISGYFFVSKKKLKLKTGLLLVLSGLIFIFCWEK